MNRAYINAHAITRHFVQRMHFPDYQGIIEMLRKTYEVTDIKIIDNFNMKIAKQVSYHLRRVASITPKMEIDCFNPLDKESYSSTTLLIELLKDFYIGQMEARENKHYIVTAETSVLPFVLSANKQGGVVELAIPSTINAYQAIAEANFIPILDDIFANDKERNLKDRICLNEIKNTLEWEKSKGNYITRSRLCQQLENYSGIVPAMTTFFTSALAAHGILEEIKVENPKEGQEYLYHLNIVDPARLDALIKGEDWSKKEENPA